MKKLLAQLEVEPQDYIVDESAYFTRPIWMNQLIKKIGKPVTYAGALLGQERKGKIKPSALYLQYLALTSDRKVIVNEKASWLFVCGRDIQGKNVLESPTMENGDWVLVCNAAEECLGYGKVHIKEDTLVTVHNLYDIGDYLRRE
jgi:ribosome biogenesis protein Nip4